MYNTKHAKRMKSIAMMACAALCAVLTVGCADDKRSHSKLPVAVSVTRVGLPMTSEGRAYIGTVEEESGTLLSFEVPGNVTTLKAQEGDHVAKGQLIGTIQPNTLRDAHQATLTSLRQAQDAYRRMKPLHAQGVISEVQWVDVQSKLLQAEAAERMAREQLGHTALRAPFSGIIAARYADPGMNVIAGQQIYRLVNVSVVEIKINVPENEIYAIHKGQAAILTVKAAGNATLTGHVSEKGIVANALSHTYDVKIAAPNPGGRLMPGMVCNVDLEKQGGDVQTRPTVLPSQCVELDTDGHRFVWVVEAGKARQRYITVGNFMGDGIVVTQGLNSGDDVITEGMQKVSDGMKVRTK